MFAACVVINPSGYTPTKRPALRAVNTPNKERAMFLVIQVDANPKPAVCDYHGKQLFADRTAADGLALIQREAYPDGHFVVYQLQSV